MLVDRNSASISTSMSSGLAVSCSPLPRKQLNASPPPSAPQLDVASGCSVPPAVCVGDAAPTQPAPPRPHYKRPTLAGASGDDGLAACVSPQSPLVWLQPPTFQVTDLTIQQLMLSAVPSEGCVLSLCRTVCSP